MAPPDDAARRLASMLASRADHPSVTADRLAGRTGTAADLEAPPVAHLREGERPRFCFESHPDGLSVGDPDAAVDPERGAVFVFTDRRVLLLVGLADGDRRVSLPYAGVAAADWREGMGRYRLDLRGETTTYYLWLPAALDRAALDRVVEHVTYRRRQADADESDVDESDADRDGGDDAGDAGDESDVDGDADDGPSVRERLERLGDAKSRGLLDEQEFQRRKEELLDERE